MQKRIPIGVLFCVQIIMVLIGVIERIPYSCRYSVLIKSTTAASVLHFGVVLPAALHVPQISCGVGIASDIYLIRGLDDILHLSDDLSFARLRLCESVSVPYTLQNVI